MSNVLVDISNNGNNGTITGAIQSLDGLVFDGVDDKVVTPNINIGKTHTILLRLAFGSSDASNSILGTPTTGTKVCVGYDGTDVFEYRADGGFNVRKNWKIGDVTDNKARNYAIIRNGFDISLYLDGILQTIFQSNENSNVDCIVKNISTRGFVSNDFFINGVIEDVKLYTINFTEQQAIDYHNQFAKRVVLNRVPSIYDPVGNLPRGMIKGTGTYIVDEITTQDSVLKELDAGIKYLQCDVGGFASLQSKHAYGTWSGYFYKADASDMFLVFIASKATARDGAVQNGYQLYFDNVEKIAIQKITNGVAANVMVTANGYLAANTWYEYVITRSLDGEFLLSLSGGAFGNTMTVVVTSPAGNNPATENTFTTSEYIVPQLALNDRLILLP